MENLMVRERAKKQKVSLWRIANEIGISEPTITRWLRVPLSQQKEKLILDAISKLSREGQNDGIA